MANSLRRVGRGLVYGLLPEVVLDLQGLFTPFQLGSAALRNRVVLPSMGRFVHERGAPGPNVIDYIRLPLRRRCQPHHDRRRVCRPHRVGR